MKFKYLCLVLAIFLFGCATASKFNNLSIGMSKQETIKILGTPRTIQAENEIEVLEYYLWPDLTSNQKEIFWVVIIDNKIYKYGPARNFPTQQNYENLNIMQIKNETILADPTQMP